MSSTPNPSCRTESSTSSRLAGEPGVDDEDAAVVGDQSPVHQVGLREVDGVGDRRDGRHGMSLCSGCEERATRVWPSGVETKTWLN